MQNSLHHILPLPQPEVEEIFSVYRTTHTFYQEVRDREDHAAYCQWYAQLAAQHLAEFDRMQREANFMAWFTRR